MSATRQAPYVVAEWLLLHLLLLGVAVRGRAKDEPSAEEIENLRSNMTDNSLLLFPADLPPLLCEVTKDSKARNNHAADFYALAKAGFLMFCSFQTDDDGDTSRLVRLNEIKLDRIFGWSDDDGQFGDYQPKRDLRAAACTQDSELPAGFFDFTALRSSEERPLKCYGNPAGEVALVSFVGFPAVLCTLDCELELGGAFSFSLPGIAGRPFRCAFAPYAAVPLAPEVPAQERLYRELISLFVPRGSTSFTRFSCSEDPDPLADVHFEALSPSGVKYRCTFIEVQSSSTID